MPDIRVQDEQGTIHVFPDGSTPEMIAQAMKVKPPSPSQNGATDTGGSSRTIGTPWSFIKGAAGTAASAIFGAGGLGEHQPLPEPTDEELKQPHSWNPLTYTDSHPLNNAAVNTWEEAKQANPIRPALENPDIAEGLGQSAANLVLLRNMFKAGGANPVDSGFLRTPKSASVLQSLGEYLENNASSARAWAEHPVQKATGALTEAAIKKTGQTLQKMAGPGPTGPSVFAPDTSIERPVEGPNPTFFTSSSTNEPLPHTTAQPRSTSAPSSSTPNPTFFTSATREIPTGTAPASSAPTTAAPKAPAGGPAVKPSTLEPANYLTFHGAEDGETAALMQLSHTGGQGLRAIAQARGLKIAAAADNPTIINKIMGDLSPDEIKSFDDAAAHRADLKQQSLAALDPDIVQANKGVAQKLYTEADKMQANGESPYRIRAWRTAAEAIETRPTAVTDILDDPAQLRTIRGVDKKMAQHIQDVMGVKQPVPVAQSQSPYVQAAKESLPANSPDAHVENTAHALADQDEHMANLLEQSIAQVPNGSFRVNAGQQLTPAQAAKLRFAVQQQ